MEPRLLYRFYFHYINIKSTIIGINVQLANRINLHTVTGCNTAQCKQHETDTQRCRFMLKELKVNTTMDHSLFYCLKYGDL